MRRLKTYLAYCGDCLEVMDSFPESCVDSIITDPPYVGRS